MFSWRNTKNNIWISPLILSGAMWLWYNNTDFSNDFQKWSYTLGAIIVIGAYLFCACTVFFGVQERKGIRPERRVPSSGPCQAIKCIRRYAKKKRSFRSPCACENYHPGLCSPFIHSVVSNDSVSEECKSWSDWADAQADLGLRCSHMPEDMRLLGAAHIYACSWTELKLYTYGEWIHFQGR